MIKKTRQPVKIKVVKRELVGAMHDWYLVASNGDLPQEGYGHATRRDAIEAVYAMYDNATWQLKIGGGFWVNIE